MGLDMYLNAKQFTSKEYFRPELYSKLVQHAPFALDHATLEVNVAYWRKVNAVHRWFVINVQNSNDDCGEYHVTREKLQELLDICKLIELNPDSAPELLPIQQGFFFGSYEYDKWYFEDIKQTIEQIESILKEVPADWDITYHSSW